MFRSRRFPFARILPRVAAVALALAVPRSNPAAANPLPPDPVMGHAPEYVIVTPAAFAGEFRRLAHWKTRYGIPALVKTLESIIAEYPSGRDDAERVRMFLQDARAQWGTQWALLGGDSPWIPSRRVHSQYFGGLDFVTDLYFSGLQGDWDANGNGVFGEADLGPGQPGDDADLSADLFVGRAPVRSAPEARAFVNKTLAVSFLPVVPRAHEVLAAGEVFLPYNWSPGQFADLDGAVMADQAATEIATHSGVHVTRLFQNWNDSRWPDAMPLGQSSLLAALRAGTDFWIAVSRGGPMVMTAGADSVTAADLAGLTDAARPTHGWWLGSSTGNFEGDCLASTWVRTATGGGVTCIAPSTLSFIGATDNFLREYIHQVYAPGEGAVGRALALAATPFAGFTGFDSIYRITQMELNLLGDPETRLYFAPPAALQLSIPPEVPVGSHGFAAFVTRDGRPVAGARVTASRDEAAMAIARTGGAGMAEVAIGMPEAGRVEVTAVAPDGGVGEGAVEIVDVLGVEGAAATRLRLDVPSPNPASSEVRFAGHTPAPARIEVFDVGGRRLRSFEIAAGRFALSWDLRDARGRRAPAGLCFARLRTASGERLQRLLIAP